jgi:hypothetical protein
MGILGEKLESGGTLSVPEALAQKEQTALGGGEKANFYPC